jgi:uncharacterized protein (TIGR02246 family)
VERWACPGLMADTQEPIDPFLVMSESLLAYLASEDSQGGCHHLGDHPNAALFRSAFDLFNAGDAEAFASLLAEDVVWHEIDGERMHGRDAVASSMSGMEGAEFEGSLHDVVGNDEHVVGLVEAHVKAGEEKISYRTAEIMHVEDGKVTDRWSFSDDTQAIIEFFSKVGG